MAKITIDGKEYETDAMSNEAKAQLMSIQFCEAELQRLQATAASMQTARTAYLMALKTELDKQDAPAPKIGVFPNETINFDKFK